MIAADRLRQATVAARESGAGEAEGFHRRSRTRLVTLHTGEPPLTGGFLEVGTAVRAWRGPGRSGLFGFAAGTAGEAAGDIGRRAAQAVSRFRRLQDNDTPPAASPAADGETVAAEPPGGNGVALAEGSVTDDEQVAIHDADILRLTPREIRRCLQTFVEAAEVARRPGLPWAVQAEIRLATMETTLLRTGEPQSFRSTLASVHLRFPTVFGLSRLELASRRLSLLDSGHVVRFLSSYPVPGRPLERLRLDTTADGEQDLHLAGPLVATLLSGLARRIAARGETLGWDCDGVLVDDPGHDWGPGSLPFDADGEPLARRILAAPRQHAAAGTAVSLPMIRLSFREPPGPAPTNLLLENVPVGKRPASPGSTLVLLEEVAHDQGVLLARGLVRQAGRDDRPALVLLEGSLERLLRGSTRAGPVRPFFAGDGFVAAPDLIVPGVRWQPR